MAGLYQEVRQSMKMSPEVQQAIADCGPALVATTSKSGRPNVSAKGSLRVLDDEHILFADVSSPQTIANLMENPQIAAICLKERHGVRLWGTAEVLTEGELFEEMAKALAARGMTIKHVVKVAIDEADLF